MKRSITRFYAMLLTVIMVFTSVPIAPVLAESVLTLPAATRIIGEEAFYHDTSLGKVVLPEGVEQICSRAFAGSSVTEVFLPESLTYIADDAFDGCENVTIDASEGSYAYDWAVTNGYIVHDYSEKQTEDGFLYIAFRTYIIITGYQGAGGAITIPSEVEGLPVTCIGCAAFSGNTGITSVAIPSCVEYIRSCAFENCTGLTGIVLPEGLNSVDYGAFQGCTALGAVSIPSSLDYLDAFAFMRCGALQSFNVASGSANFSAAGGVLFNADGSELLRYPSGRANSAYTVPEAVTAVGEDAFDSASHLTKVILLEGPHIDRRLRIPRLHEPGGDCAAGEPGIDWLQRLQRLRGVDGDAHPDGGSADRRRRVRRLPEPDDLRRGGNGSGDICRREQYPVHRHQ